MFVPEIIPCHLLWKPGVATTSLNTPNTAQSRADNTHHQSLEHRTPAMDTVNPPKPKAQSLNPKVQTLSLPEHIIQQGRFVEKDGKKVLMLPPHVLQQHQENMARQQQQQQQQQSLLLNNSLLSPSRTDGSQAKPLFSPSTENNDKFELTDDYIQQTIKDALKSGNLTPELEEKLIKQLETSSGAVEEGAGGGGVGAKIRRSAAAKVSFFLCWIFFLVSGVSHVFTVCFIRIRIQPKI